MLKCTVKGRRYEYVLKFEGGKITTQKVERTDSDKEQQKESVATPIVVKAENKSVTIFDEFLPPNKDRVITAKYLGKRMIEVTVSAGDIKASRIYKETLSLNESAKRIRKIVEDFMLEDGIYVKEEEVYQAIGKATEGLSGIHIRSFYYF